MRFERVTEERFGEVIQHLKMAFFADEPLNKAVGLCKPGEGHFELERHSLITLVNIQITRYLSLSRTFTKSILTVHQADNLSVMALSEDNRVVGVALNGILHRGDIEKAQETLQRSNDERFVKIFNFLYQGNKHTFQELNVDRIFEIRILSVDSE